MIIIVIIIIIITKTIIRYIERIRDKIFRRRLTCRLLTCAVGRRRRNGMRERERGGDVKHAPWPQLQLIDVIIIITVILV